jgi:tol-pal system protein YbgF
MTSQFHRGSRPWEAIKFETGSFIMRRFIAVILVSFTAHVPFAAAQDAGRIDQLEDQIRRLTGQVEELTFAVKQLQTQIAAPRKASTLTVPQQKAVSTQEAKAPALAPAQGTDVAATETMPKLTDGIEVIEEQPLAQVAVQPVEPLVQPQTQDSIYGDEPVAAPGPAKLGSVNNAAAQPNDGGFQGQVIEDPAAAGQIQQVSLVEETPEALYKRSDEALLRRQFGDAESGFKRFLTTYPDHNLAGSAQYWLGETYYAQGDYKAAAQNFLNGYQKYAKSRRAPDSLLKLGLALNKLGQKEQACSFLGSVSGEYPKAVEAGKRAQAEYKRAGC